MARASEARRHVQEAKPLWLVGVTDRPLPVAACNPVIEGPLLRECRTAHARSMLGYDRFAHRL